LASFVAVCAVTVLSSPLAGGYHRRIGRSFGLTVDAMEAQEHRSTGSFGWAGAFGTTFWVDPKEEMTALLGVSCRKVSEECATESSVVRTTAVT